MWLISILLFNVAMLAIQLLRFRDRAFEEAVWRNLAAEQGSETILFDPASIAGLPDPAQRYFCYCIEPGARISSIAEISMRGEIGLGTKEDPRYRPFTARQILAAPAGFVWRVHAGGGLTRFIGSDGYFRGGGWTRFWLSNLFPVVRAGWTPDYARSAAARGIAEALFWTPAALLPRENVRWKSVNENTARVVVTHRSEEFATDLTVADDGKPLSVVCQRWSRENPEHVWRFQPFGGTVEGTAKYGSFTIASRIEGGNHFGTPDYFPFYRAHVTGCRFIS